MALADKFIVKKRFQQHEFIYKIMRSEKAVVFLILSFILFIASFNILGSVSMLVLDTYWGSMKIIPLSPHQ
mgnify:CR=1 FL=1